MRVICSLQTICNDAMDLWKLSPASGACPTAILSEVGRLLAPEPQSCQNNVRPPYQGGDDDEVHDGIDNHNDYHVYKHKDSHKSMPLQCLPEPHYLTITTPTLTARLQRLPPPAQPHCIQIQLQHNDTTLYHHCTFFSTHWLKPM